MSTLRGHAVLTAILAGASFLLPALSHAALGSIIQSFDLPSISGYIYGGIYPDSGYVYWFLAGVTNYQPRILKLTTTGSVVQTINSNAGPTFPGDADNSHRGPGIMAVQDHYSSTTPELLFIRASTSSRVGHFNPGSCNPYNLSVMWNGTYYYANGYNDRGLFQVYTTGGTRLASWTASGWPASMSTCGGTAYAAKVNNQTGDYLIANSATSNEPSCVIDMANGSCLATFSHPGGGRYGVVTASSRPGLYGETFWTVWQQGGQPLRVYEIDLGTTSAVSPASVGRIKTLFR